MTPLQMAEVAAAVANGGSLMKPQIWSRVVDPDGRVTERLDPSEYSQPIDEETAAELTTAMEGVVSEGTGTNAAISGVAVAGKTGTAETPFNETCGGGSEENQAWFIGFAPADDPQIAIAATVECTTAFGGDIAAPIFRDVAETISQRRELTLRLRSAREHDRRPLPAAAPDRLGRYGGRLAGRGPAPAAPRGAQGPAPALRPGPRVRRALPPRG